MYEERETTTPSRHKERATFEAAVVHSILDEAMIGHLAFIDGERPHILPLLFVRIDSAVYLHASPAAHPARLVGKGTLPVTFEVTLIDGLVLARSHFSHSANYRTVIAHGELTMVRDPELKSTVFRALVEKLLPGRADDARSPDETEIRKTAVMEMQLTEVGAKVRSGDPIDDEADLVLPVWAGVRPLMTHWGPLQPAKNLDKDVPVPAYLVGEATKH